ncbi:hypothetical protein MoryE10_11830 [Methylogaea oryzae]|uniref:WD40 repeat domain-containing protein n=2 Tax=Methylogaea oryzae TaxID=1295382 RepID=A0A8D4VP04_9GAMM|nr:hypothetical protein MoryE10_11830 [Methylogaea oryzae]
MLVSASSDYTARIWELPTLRLLAVLSGHQDDVDMAAFSNDKKFVATCALDRAIRIFHLNGTCLRTLRGHTGNIISLLWSANDDYLFSSSVDGTVRKWCAETGRELDCYDLDGVRTDTIAIDAQGRIFAGDDQGRIGIIENSRPRYVSAHKAGIKKLVYCDQAQMLVSLSYDRSLALWKIGDDASVTELRRTSMPAMVWARAAAILADATIAVGTFGNRYAIYDWRQDTWDTEDIEVNEGANAIAFHQRGIYTIGDAGLLRKDGHAIMSMGSLCNFLLSSSDRLYTGGQLGQLFEAISGTLIYQHHSPLNCATTIRLDNGDFIAVGTYTGEILIFAVQVDQSLRFEAEIQVYQNAIKGLACAGHRLFSVCASTDIAWHDCRDWRLIAKRKHAHEKIVNACCRFGDNGFASVGRDRTLRIWLEGAQETYQTPHAHSVKCLCASADGKRLLTGSYGGTLAEFDSATRAWTSFRKPTVAGISAIAYDTTNHRFLATSYDGEIHIVD